MARQLFGLEKGIRVYRENNDTDFFDIIFGSAAPGGDAGEQDAAPQGSLYIRQNGASSTIYQKIGTANSTADWQENGSTSLQLGFRPEKIRAITSENVTAGARDLTTTPFTDDDGTTLSATDFAVGEFIISNSGATAVLLEVTAVSAPSVTFSTPTSAPALAAFDTFLTPNYLPDPNGQENQALVQVNSAGAIVKVADVDWNFATGINLSAGYTPGSGNITTSDSVESAIQKLDGNNDAQDTLLGTAQGATNLGTFTGNIIADNESVKDALQQLETEVEKGRVSVDGVTVLQTVDSVLVDEVCAIKWYVWVQEVATREVKAYEIFAAHNGDDSNDATDVDFHDPILKVDGANFNLTVNVGLGGSGVTQAMNLTIATTTGGVDVRVRRVEIYY